VPVRSTRAGAVVRSQEDGDSIPGPGPAGDSASSSMFRRLRPSRRIALAALLTAVLLVAAGVWWFATAPDGFRGPQCRQGLGVCREISGRVLYVEEQDPDGDGDVHLVLLSRDSLTRTYISVLKLERDERPADLPGFGRWVGATGRPYIGAGGERNLDVGRLLVKR
jgi:hypothetical protein